MELGTLRDEVFATEFSEGTEIFILYLGAARPGLTADGADVRRGFWLQGAAATGGAQRIGGAVMTTRS